MMNEPVQPINGDERSSELAQKLMVSGFVCPESSCALSIEVRRGMSIHSSDGLEVGKVAAVVLDDGDRKATHLLLSRLPERDGYWMVPMSAIAEVDDVRVQLSMTAQAIEILPLWHAK